MNGARAIVLGGSGALGRAICESLAAEGARVALVYRSREDVARVMEAKYTEKQAGSVIGVRADLETAEGTRRAMTESIATLGGCDALVHAAAIASTREPPVFDRVADIDDAGLERLFAINVKSAIVACQSLAASVGPNAREGARAVNVVLIGSIDGEKSVPTTAPYAASKAALSGVARAFAKELGPRGILINVVAPGILESGASSVVPEDVRREYLKHACARRYGTHAEVAAFIAWMATCNTYVTGKTIGLDGGL